MGQLVFISWLLVGLVNGGELLNLTSLPQGKQNYDIKENFCRLWAHTSVLLDQSQRIVIDGGMAKFKVMKNDDPGDFWEVPDLRKWNKYSSNH